MFSFRKNELQRFIISSVGAVALSAACVGAAVAPAKAANAPLSAAEWQDQVARKVDGLRETGRVTVPGKLTKAEVAVHFSREGDFAGATLARSSGNKALDARAVTAASRISYPALPAGYRGQPQTVRMDLYFGGVDHQAEYAAIRDRVNRKLQMASAKNDADTQIAAR
jgi:TonB family protein